MRSFIRLSLTIIATMSIIAGCQEVVEIDLPNDDPKLVIEGLLVYHQQNPAQSECQVKLSTTGNFYNDEIDNPVTDALVQIMDEETGQTYDLTTVEDQPGAFTHSQIIMDSAKSFQLRVSYNNEEYEASGTVLPVAQVDSFSVKYREESFFTEPGFYLFFSGSTPKEQGINYYRFTISENDSLYNDQGDYLIQSDELLSPQIDTLQLANYAFNTGDTIAINMYSLNKDVFEYYNELIELLFNDGGVFSSPPRNPTSNIQNITTPNEPPLGFFQVSTVYGDTIIIDQEEPAME